MNRTMANLFLGMIVSASLGAAVTLSAPAADSKPKVTITDRIEILSKKIEKGQKANELTLKEADKLRSDITKINEKIEKAKSKNAGKLSYEDETKIEKDLNKVSVKLTAKELEKRTTSPN